MTNILVSKPNKEVIKEPDNNIQTKALAAVNQCFDCGISLETPGLIKQELRVSPIDNDIQIKPTPKFPGVRKSKVECLRVLSAPTTPTIRPGDTMPMKSSSQSPLQKQKKSARLMPCWGACIRYNEMKKLAGLMSRWGTGARHNEMKEKAPPACSSSTCSHFLAANHPFPKKKEKLARLGSYPSSFYTPTIAFRIARAKSHHKSQLPPFHLANPSMIILSKSSRAICKLMDTNPRKQKDKIIVSFVRCFQVPMWEIP